MKITVKVFTSLILMFIFFTSCQSIKIETDVINLMKPPTLSGEQAEIYGALQDQVAEGIKIKYPKSGDYRSAFIFQDIDKDGQDEVIAFFELDDASRDRFRIALLTYDGQNWNLLEHIPVLAKDIVSVSFETFYDNKLHVLVGYEQENQRNLLQSYVYEEGKFYSNYETDYQSYKVIFSDDGTYNRLAVVREIFGNLDYMTFEIVDQFVSMDTMITSGIENHSEDSFKITASLMLPAGQKQKYIITQDIDKEREKTYIFLDCFRFENELFTQIIEINDTEIGLSSKILPEENLTTRRHIIPSMDLDLDGHVEVPLLDMENSIGTIIDGAKSYEISFYDWYGMVDGNFKLKYSTVYNSGSEYFYIIPAQWRGKLSVETLETRNEIVLYSPSGGSAPDSELNELARLLTVPLIQVDNIHISEEYELIKTTETNAYYRKISKDANLNEELLEEFAVWKEISYDSLFN